VVADVGEQGVIITAQLDSAADRPPWRTALVTSSWTAMTKSSIVSPASPQARALSWTAGRSEGRSSAVKSYAVVPDRALRASGRSTALTASLAAGPSGFMAPVARRYH
jgi:hypothetical protein